MPTPIRPIPSENTTGWYAWVAEVDAAARAASTSADVDAKIATQAASDGATYVTLRGPWAAATLFPKNSVVIQAGFAYLAAADVPARTTFTVADWQPLGGGTSGGGGTTYLPLSTDTDGVYYYAAGAYVGIDTDGVPYFTATPDSSSKAVLVDTDGAYYFAA